MARGQDNWQIWSILLLDDTFLNTAEKRPSFLGTKCLAISLCLAT